MGEGKKEGLKYISLGYNCTLALTLRSVGIREEAYPFDWLETDILSLPEMFKLRFSDFLTNVKSYIPTKKYAKNKPWPYFCDSKYKTFHWHDEPTISEEIIDKYKKRTERLMKLLDDNEEELVFMRIIGLDTSKGQLEFWNNDTENPELREFRLREKYCTDIKLDIEKGKKVLLFFGMIKKVKGLDILLSSLTEVIKKHSDVVLLIAGKPWKDDFSNYQKLIDELAISKYCKLDIKFISHSDVSNYYSAADIVVLPYRKIYQSGVLMMSLSYKKPVVVSDLPSFKEIIENNRTGYIFQSENSLDLSRVINQALDNPKLLEEIKQNGYDLIATDYKWEMIGKKTLDAYLKINYFSKK